MPLASRSQRSRSRIRSVSRVSLALQSVLSRWHVARSSTASYLCAMSHNLASIGTSNAHPLTTSIPAAQHPRCAGRMKLLGDGRKRRRQIAKLSLPTGERQCWGICSIGVCGKPDMCELPTARTEKHSEGRALLERSTMPPCQLEVLELKPWLPRYVEGAASSPGYTQKAR